MQLKVSDTKVKKWWKKYHLRDLSAGKPPGRKQKGMFAHIQNYVFNITFNMFQKSVRY